jgi:hypothetical protein
MVKGIDVNRNASYEFKYVIDGTFVNEPDRFFQNACRK